MTVWAVIPVKRFRAAKSRLAEAFAPAARATLAKAMLGDVLDAVAQSRAFDGLLLVTSDPDAASIGAAFGTHAIEDLSETGTNDAVRQGLAELRRRAATGAAVIPADLPYLTAGEISTVVSALRTSPVVVAPAVRDGGTNVLALSPPDIIATAYGRGSFDRHVALAAALGVSATVLDLPGASIDVDVPSDLQLRPDRGARTAAALRRLRPPEVPKPLARREWACP